MKCRNCGKEEKDHHYYYKACISLEETRWRFEPEDREVNAKEGEK